MGHDQINNGSRNIGVIFVMASPSMLYQAERATLQKAPNFRLYPILRSSPEHLFTNLSPSCPWGFYRKWAVCQGLDFMGPLSSKYSP